MIIASGNTLFVRTLHIHPLILASSEMSPPGRSRRGGHGGIVKDSHSRHTRRDLLEQPQPIRSVWYSMYAPARFLNSRHPNDTAMRHQRR